MPIDPSMLAKSIGTLTDLDPQRDLAKTLQDAVVAAQAAVRCRCRRGHAGRR
jgi:hypothetical protein